MVKSVLPKIICSLAIGFFIACDISPTYTRENIEEAVIKICSQEYDLKVKVWDVGNTVWIYAPLNILDEKGEWKMNTQGELDEDVAAKIRNIRNSITRVFLSVDRPPKFYCLIISDIEKIGLDWFTVVHIPDEVKYVTEQYSFGHVSSQGFRERIVSFPAPNYRALGDAEGKHIRKTDITMPDFISMLINQNIQKKLMIPELKINDLRTHYYNNTLYVIFNVEVKEKKDNLPSPFEEARKAIKKVLQMYDFEEVKNVEINDTLNKTRRTYTRRALLEG